LLFLLESLGEIYVVLIDGSTSIFLSSFVLLRFSLKINYFSFYSDDELNIEVYDLSFLNSIEFSPSVTLLMDLLFTRNCFLVTNFNLFLNFPVLLFSLLLIEFEVTSTLFNI
jgi:hypothetical protein